LEGCKQAGAPQVSHIKNGSPKAKKNSKLSSASQRNKKDQPK
jgi:hypothetical protein